MRERKGSEMTARFLNGFAKKVELTFVEKGKAVTGASLRKCDCTHLEFVR